MKIILAGGSGYLGVILAQRFIDQSNEVVVLTRSEKTVLPQGVKKVLWDGETLGDWTKELESSDVLINLSGRTVNCRYNEKNKKEIIDSRVLSTQVLASALDQLISKPKLWLNFASATIYKYSLDTDMTELTGEIGSGFSVEVCKAWEKAFFDKSNPEVRKVALRLAMVMGLSDGPLIPLIAHAKLGLSGRHVDGKQYVSWISEVDFIEVVEFLISNETIEGPVNVCSPNPVSNQEFMKALNKVFGFGWGLYLSTWMLEVGAWVMGTETELITKSRRVVPDKLLKSGFQFKHPKVLEYFQFLKNKS
jgi:uncharacterized protein